MASNVALAANKMKNSFTLVQVKVSMVAHSNIPTQNGFLTGLLGLVA